MNSEVTKEEMTLFDAIDDDEKVANAVVGVYGTAWRSGYKAGFDTDKRIKTATIFTVGVVVGLLALIPLTYVAQ